MPGPDSPSARAATSGVMSAAAAALRLAKHLVLGGLQFVNVPLAFAMASGAEFGPAVGGTVGAVAFLASDLVLGPGPWTALDSALAAAVGAAWGMARPSGRARVLAAAFLSTLAYDLASSILFYLVLGMTPVQAAAAGILGLFLPAAGGGLVGVGPVTEAATAALTLAAAEAAHSSSHSPSG